MDVEDRPWLCLGTSQSIQGSLEALWIFHNWWRLHRPLPFQEKLLRAYDLPTVFQEDIDKVLDFKTPVWLDDIISVTNGSVDDHNRDLREVLAKLEKAGYRASERMTKMFKNLARLPHKPERSKADKRQHWSNNETGSPEKCKRIEFISGLDTTPIRMRKQPVQENRQDAEIVEETFQVGMDNRNKWRLRKIK